MRENANLTAIEPHRTHLQVGFRCFREKRLLAKVPVNWTMIPTVRLLSNRTQSFLLAQQYNVNVEYVCTPLFTATGPDSTTTSKVWPLYAKISTELTWPGYISQKSQLHDYFPWIDNVFPRVTMTAMPNRRLFLATPSATFATKREWWFKLGHTSHALLTKKSLKPSSGVWARKQRICAEQYLAQAILCRRGDAKPPNAPQFEQRKQIAILEQAIEGYDRSE